ncbi:MAG: hypothetical protein Q9165_007383 [Trypethelium subeluteriae]
MDDFGELVEPRKSVDFDIEEIEIRDQRQQSIGGSIFSQTVRKIRNTRYSKLLPSPIQNLISPADDPEPSPRSTAWLDGIRGYAAMVVFFEHISLSVQDQHSMVRAYGSPGATSLWQVPIIRLLYDGTPMVPIFYVTSGCALSLKPLSHIHKGEWQNFRTTMSSATFRRVFRLFLPSAAVSFLAMLFTQMGIYSHSYPFLNNGVMELDLPQRLPNLAAQYVDWLNWVATKLLYSEEIFQPLSGTTYSNYGFQLWTISTEFWASTALFITLVGLAQLPVFRRQFLVFCLCGFAFFVDRWDIACFMAGISITELSTLATASNKQDQEPPSLPKSIRSTSTRSWLPTFHQYAVALVFVAGLFIASYPGKQASENFIYRPFWAVVDSVRFWESMGAILMLASTSQLRLIQKLLTSATSRYLGRISYGVYLTHVAFLNVIGWRITPWICGLATGHQGWWGHQASFAVGLVVCSLLLIWIADVWTRAVDEPCVRLAKKVERWATSS